MEATSGFGVKGFGLRIKGLGLRVEVLGFNPSLAQCSGSFIFFSPWLFLRPLNQAQGRIVLIVVVIFDQLAPLASIKIAILQSLEGRKGRV